MVKLDLTETLKGLDGKPLLDSGEILSLGKVLANILINNPSADNADVLRLYELSKDIYSAPEWKSNKEEEIAFLEKYVKASQTVPIVKGQILQIIQRAKNQTP